jgi:hypothetical protein
MASTQSDILTAVRTAINNLSLTGVDEVRVRVAPDDGKHVYPGITVSPRTELEFPGTNNLDDIGYGITVTMVSNDDADVTEDDLVGDWRQKIRKKFIHQKLAGITNCCTVLCDFDRYDVENNRNLTISVLGLRVIVRETRG